MSPVKPGPQLRDELLAQIRPDQAFHLLFDHLPGVLFFAKDCDGRLFAANRAFASTLRLRGRYQILGALPISNYSRIALPKSSDRTI